MVLDPCLEMEQNFVKLLKETSLEEIKGWSEKSKTIWAKRIFIGSQVTTLLKNFTILGTV